VWQAVRKNFGLKLLALSIAIVAWAYVRFAGNPVIAAHFDQQLSVPIAISGLAPGRDAHLSEKQALVTVAAPHGGAAIKPDQVRAVIDLAEHPVGVFSAPVAIIAPDVEVKRVEPNTVTVEIDTLPAVPEAHE
jgi:hypothetical protein